MIRQTKAAASTAAQNQKLNNAGGISKDSGFVDYVENQPKTQPKRCDKCNPPLVEPKGELQFCGECRAEEAHTAAVLLANFRQHRKVWILDRECDSCRKPKTSAMMMRRQNVCRACFSKMTQTTAAARNRMIASAVNNQHKRLREVIYAR